MPGHKKNKDKIREFATMLTDEWIYVHLDQWENKPGQDLPKQMEKLLDTNSVDYILILCDKLYQEKANNRKGGVGAETLIITQEVYDNAEQTKIIPIVWERDEEGKCFLPVYLKSRQYIDLSDEKRFMVEFETLLRTIKGKPLYERPPLGTNPTPLDSKSTFKINRFNTSISINSLKANLETINEVSDEFFEKILSDLKNITFDTTDYSEQEIISKSLPEHLKSYKTLRDCLIDYLYFITKKSNSSNLETETSQIFLKN